MKWIKDIVGHISGTVAQTNHSTVRWQWFHQVTASSLELFKGNVGCHYDKKRVSNNRGSVSFFFLPSPFFMILGCVTGVGCPKERLCVAGTCLEAKNRWPAGRTGFISRVDWSKALWVTELTLIKASECILVTNYLQWWRVLTSENVTWGRSKKAD